MKAARLALLAIASLVGLQSQGAAQRIRTGVVPDTVTVGDVFRVVVRVDLPAGHRAELPDTLPVAGDVENAGRRQQTVDTLPGGGRRITAVYSLTVWRPGPASLPAVPVRLIGEEQSRVAQATFPALIVRSVLPPDTTGIQPRPAKDVLGGTGSLWPYILAGLGVLMLGGTLAYWLARRRRRPAPDLVVPAAPPKERALAALDRAASSGLIELGDFKTFYSLVTEAVRHYLAEINPAWGADLTTSELLTRFRGEVDERTLTGLGRVLEPADLVKFARRVPTEAEALAEWQAARQWVEGFDWTPLQAADLPTAAEVA